MDKNAYKCIADRRFTDHQGEQWSLGKSNKPVVAADIESTLNDHADGKYTISQVEYLKNTNKLKYTVSFAPYTLSDNDTFVHDDVEFYATRLADEKVNALYFNEFKKGGMMSLVKEIAIESNKFTLNDDDYAIEVDETGKAIRVRVDTAPIPETDDEDYADYKCEVSLDDKGNERICMDGLWYVLVKEDGAYTKLTFAEFDDKQFKKIDIITDGDKMGKGWYAPWGLQFQFDTSTWRSVGVVKKHQSDIINRVVEEWCEFDEATTTPGVAFFTPSKTFDWYVSNQLTHIAEHYPDQWYIGLGLGNGVLYDGNLFTSCTLNFVNAVDGGVVTTYGELAFPDGRTQRIEALFDGKLKETKCVVRGSLKSYGLIDTEERGKVFVLKNKAGVKNNCNSAWVDEVIWNQSVRLV